MTTAPATGWSAVHLGVDARARPLRELRPHAPGDRRAVRRRPGAPGHRPGARRLLPRGRRLLLRRSAHGGGEGGARRHRRRRARPGDPRARARHRRAAADRRLRAPRPTSRSRSSTGRSGAWSRSASRSTPTRAKATYEDGILRVELPIVAPRERRRSVPVEVPRAPALVTGPARASRSRSSREATTGRGARRLAARPARPAAARHGPLPGDGRSRSPSARSARCALVNDALAGNRMLVMVASRDPARGGTGPRRACYEVGVAGVIARMIKVPDGSLRILVQGGQRVRITRWISEEPYLVAEIAARARRGPRVARARWRSCATSSRPSRRSSSRCPTCPRSCSSRWPTSTIPSALSQPHRRRRCGSSPRRSRRCSRRSTSASGCGGCRRSSRASSRSSRSARSIQSQVQSELDRGQREYVLRQQLKAIQEELGEIDESVAEANELREQLDGDRSARGGAPAGRSRALAPGAAPARGRGARRHPHLPGVDRFAALGPLDRGQPRSRARAAVLDEDHYDIEAVKDRIIEFLAVRKLAAEGCARLDDPVLRRAARRGQDVARALDRAHARAARSSASASAASTTRPRSAGTGAPTSARCPGRSSARCATPAPTTRCS